MRLRHLIPTVIAASLLCEAALAGPATVYQPTSVSKTHSGYSETQLDVNRLRVSFAGEPGTEKEAVETNLLFRAAEITLQRGYDYFVVVDHSVDSRTESKRKGPPLPPLLPKRTEESTRFTSTSEILLFKGARPADQPAAYDARVLQTNLQWQIVRR